jgi:LDH2 family malate/lactate/ureidoglycolate dehydrogenase
MTTARRILRIAFHANIACGVRKVDATMSATTSRLVPADVLRAAVSAAFESGGLARGDADQVAEVLVDADLRGLESHGVQRAAVYLQRLRAGLAAGSEAIAEERRLGAAVRLDAGHALGPLAAIRAIDIACSLAREHAVGLVVAGGSTHFGHAGYYARRAAMRGLAAIVCSNGPGNMAPYGSRERFVGTNPLAIGIPLGARPEFVLDISSAATARGKIIRARDAGRAIPAGLAIDRDGRPTTDAGEALDGSVLPFAGAKGSGLALAIELLAATLAGADFDHQAAAMHTDFDRPQNLGQVFVCIDPAALNPSGDPDPGAMIDQLHALHPSVEGRPVRYPGEASQALFVERSRDGVSVDAAVLRSIAAQAAGEASSALARLAGEIGTP